MKHAPLSSHYLLSVYFRDEKALYLEIGIIIGVYMNESPQLSIERRGYDALSSCICELLAANTQLFLATSISIIAVSLCVLVLADDWKLGLVRPEVSTLNCL